MAAASPAATTKGLLPATAKVWEGWFRAWFAGHWTEDDLPQLRLVIRLHDRVGRGDVKRVPELRQWLDSFGITIKGQQDRRWQRPEPPRPRSNLDRYRSGPSPYDHLRVPRDPHSAKERFARLAAADERPSAKERLAVLEGRVGSDGSPLERT